MSTQDTLANDFRGSNMNLMMLGSTAEAVIPLEAHAVGLDNTDTITDTSNSGGYEQKITVSMWAKDPLSSLGSFLVNLNGGSGSSVISFYVNTSGKVIFGSGATSSGSSGGSFSTQNGDFTADTWHHLHLVLDSTLATASDRIKFYIDNTRITSFASGPGTITQNATLDAWRAGQRYHGREGVQVGSAIANLAFINVVMGDALEPSAFAVDNGGTWSAIEPVVPSYGTGGYYLDFSDPTSATTLGYDASGNGNHFTTSGLVDLVSDLPPVA